AASELSAGRWPGRLYNDYSWGGYLIWRLWPARKVFIDGRAEVYYNSCFEDTRTLQFAQTGWDEALDRWHVATVITDARGDLAREMDRAPAWERVYRDPTACIYARRLPAVDE